MSKLKVFIKLIIAHLVIISENRQEIQINLPREEYG